MFGEKFTSIPIVQASIDGSMSPEKNWALGKAVAQLRLVNSNEIASYLTLFSQGRRNSCVVRGADSS